MLKPKIWTYVRTRPWLRGAIACGVMLWVFFFTGLFVVDWVYIVLGLVLGLVLNRKAWLASFWGATMGFGTLHIWYTIMDVTMRIQSKEAVEYQELLKVQSVCMTKLIVPGFAYLLAGTLAGVVLLRGYSFLASERR